MADNTSDIRGGNGAGSAGGPADFVIGAPNGDRALRRLMGHGHGHGHGYGGGLSGDQILPTHQQPGADSLGDNDWRHTVLRIEFLMETKWRDIELAHPFADGSEATVNEIEAIKNKLDNKEESPARILEIMSETKSFVGVFENILHYNSHSHPLTADLVATAVTIGWDVVQYFKEQFGRNRPSVVDPRIKPLIRVPGFGAYPSGHATQAHLVANVLTHLISAFDGGTDSKFARASRFMSPIKAAATRIGVNREWAGVHYASDTVAGEDLAMKIWNLAILNKNFEALIDDARREWTRGFQSQIKFLKKKT